MADFYERGRESQPLLANVPRPERDLAEAEAHIISKIKESQEGAWRSQLTVWQGGLACSPKSKISALHIQMRTKHGRLMTSRTHMQARAVIVGLLVGTLMNFTNMYFGLLTGWVTMGSIQVCRECTSVCLAAIDPCLTFAIASRNQLCNGARVFTSYTGNVRQLHCFDLSHNGAHVWENTHARTRARLWGLPHSKGGTDTHAHAPPSLQSALLGFGICRLGEKLELPGLREPLTPLENVVIQTTAVATATMPLAGGMWEVACPPKSFPPDSVDLLSLVSSPTPFENAAVASLFPRFSFPPSVA